MRALGAAFVALLALLAAGAAGAAGAGEADTLGGFSLAGLRVRRDLLIAGGPERDRIRAIDAPSFATPEQAVWVLGNNPVLGVTLGGEAHGYPEHVLEHHFVVNDVLGATPLLVLYDALAGAPFAFRRDPGGVTRRFGVSGLVYNGTSVLFDRESESLWVPMLGEAIAGPLAGTKLEPVPVVREPRDVWLAHEPSSTLLARADHTIDYRYSPYERYWVEDRIPFPVAAKDERFHAKEIALGVIAPAKGTPPALVRAYLGSELTRAGGRVVDDVGGGKLKILYDGEDACVIVQTPKSVTTQEAYWFAWKAFHPETSVWRADATADAK